MDLVDDRFYSAAMTERSSLALLYGLTTVLMLFIALPFFLYTQRPSYQGLVPLRTNDDGAYYDRIQTALLGRYDEVDNGITGGNIKGAGSVLPELFIGFALAGTGLHGPEAGALAIIVCAPLFFLFFTRFLRRIGALPWIALAAAAACTVVLLSPLQRPINLSFTLPLTALTLLLFARVQSGPSPWTYLVPTVVVTAILPGIYFWAWTFLWMTLLCMYLLSTFTLPSSTDHQRLSLRLLVTGGLTALGSVPLLQRIWLSQATNPHFADTAYYRSGVYPSYWIESPIRSVLLLLLVLCSAVLFICNRTLRRSLLLPFALSLSAFIVMHQNLLHGKDLMFSSHYYPFICLMAVTLAAWVLSHFEVGILSWRKIVTVERICGSVMVMIAAIFLLAGLWDYRIAWSLPFAPEKHLDLQVLAPALRLLEDGNRQTILTDKRSALMVKAWTDDDVVFTAYVQSLFVSNAEFAERACLAEFLSPAGPDIRAIAWETTQYRGEHLLPQREKDFRTICHTLLKQPSLALRKYHVDLLLWNEVLHPEWEIDEELFEKTEQGEGWSMWKMRGE